MVLKPRHCCVDTCKMCRSITFISLSCKASGVRRVLKFFNRAWVSKNISLSVTSISSHSFEARKLKVDRNNPHINGTKLTNQFLIFCLGPKIFEVKDGGWKKHNCISSNGLVCFVKPSFLSSQTKYETSKWSIFCKGWGCLDPNF